MKPGDKLVLISGILFVGWLYSVLWFPSDGADDHQGHFAQVTIEGKDQLVFNLKEDKIVETNGLVGLSKLEVLAGRIRFLQSPCPNKLCINNGWLEQGGEFAACLPNRIAVEVIASHNVFDSINF